MFQYFESYNYFPSMFKNGTLDYSFPIEKDGQTIAIQQNKH